MYVYMNIRNIVIPEYIGPLKGNVLFVTTSFDRSSSTLTTIEAHAFHNCTNLRSVIFKDKLTK